MNKISARQKQDDKAPVSKVKKAEAATHPAVHTLEQPTLSTLQTHLGNAAVQRLLGQCSGDGAFDLDGVTTASTASVAMSSSAYGLLRRDYVIES